MTKAITRGQLPAALFSALVIVLTTVAALAPAAPPARPNVQPHVDAPAAAASPKSARLRYAFNDVKVAVYQVVIQAELGEETETISGHLVYYIDSVDPNSGDITLRCASQLNTTRSRVTNGQAPPKIEIQPLTLSLTDAPGGLTPTTIDANGGVIRAQHDTNDHSLPYFLGMPFDLMINRLPADARAVWGFGGKTSYYEWEKPSQAPQPGFMHNDPKPTRYTEHAASERIAFAISSTRDNLVTVKRQGELTSDEMAGDEPLLRIRMDGKFVFDAKTGMIQSLESKNLYQRNAKNMTYKVPITLSVQLLSMVDVAKLAEDARLRRAEEERRQAWAKIPNGAVTTMLLGGHGGGPFVNTNPDRKPLLGIHLEFLNFMNRKCISAAKPLYEKPVEPAKNGGEDVFAEDSYAVAGIIGNVSEEGLHSACIIFARLNGRKIDINDSYMSDWYGDRVGSTELQIAGEGETIVGIYGRQGLCTDAIGLVYINPPPAKPPAAADVAKFKEIEDGWQANSGKATDLTGTMVGAFGRDSRGFIALGDSQHMETPRSFATPVTFRAIVRTNNNDIRLSHPANLIIFNWDIRPDELRIEGGPANWQHKAGAGRLPANQWCGIELVVHADEMVIYIDGKERYRAKGDFSKIDKPFSITSQRETTLVKSISVVK